MNQWYPDAKRRETLGWFLLAIAFGVGLLSIYWGQFGDEADNLVVGALIADGYALYSDVFSHHFPFPYYWMAIVVGLFGKSIFAARLSLLVFQSLAFGLGMKLSRSYLLVGAAAVVWSLVRPFYKGNLVLYSSFAAVSLLVVFLVVLTVLRQPRTATWKHWLVIGIFSVVAILSDPLSVYAVAVALIFLVSKKPACGLGAGAVVMGFLALYAGYLMLAGSFPVFWDSAILFNTQVYGKYLDTAPLRIRALWQMIAAGLEIADQAWFNLDPLKAITGSYSEMDRWVYSGFLFRFSIIAVAVFLTLRRQFRAAAFVYLFAASTLIINKWEFRGQPFVVLSVVAVAALITGEWWRSGPVPSVPEASAGSLDSADVAVPTWRISRGRLLTTSQIVVGLFTLVLAGWLCLRLGAHIFRHLDAYGRDQFAVYEQDMAEIEELTCFEADVLLAHYPYGSYWYWFTDMKPVSRYVFMWPWVADIGLDEVVHELDQDEVLAVVVRLEDTVWGKHDTREYLRSLDGFLQTNYHRVSEGIFVSPALYDRCPR